jgi:DNA-directed RNA polymerase subunit alpha
MRIRWRNFELPSKVVPDKATLTKEYGRFVVEPFEQGFGHTIGNGLRRVLLSSIEGTAVTAVRIEGASHEFDSLTGVLEDVTDIILNVKRLRIRHDGNDPITCRIHKKGKGPVTGADVQCPGDAKVVSSDLHLLTLTSARAAATCRPRRTWSTRTSSGRSRWIRSTLPSTACATRSRRPASASSRTMTAS